MALQQKIHVEVETVGREKIGKKTWGNNNQKHFRANSVTNL